MKGRMLKLCCTLLLIFTAVHAEVLIPADDSRIQYFGRWDMTQSTAPSHSWPGVYIYAEFEGTSIGGRFNDNFNYYNVIIDGEIEAIFHGTNSGITDYTLASGLEDTNHTILLLKRSETGWSSHSFHGFTLEDGKTLLEPSDRPVRKIEFIGDSFTSASGNEAPTQDPPEDMAFYTNIYEGFGPIIARNYEAQFHMTSISGYGMVLDYTGNYAGNLPDKFNRTNVQTANPVWDFEQWIPNLVVIGLGLNDYSGFGGYEGSLAESETELYKTQYHEFIGTIRDHYAGIRIVAVATHVEWMRETIAEIVSEENEAGNLDVSYAQYSYYEGGYVNSGHPNVATHHGIAEELIAVIDSINAWEPYNDGISPVIIDCPETHFISYEDTFDIEVDTDSYATLKYDFEDLSFEDMAFTFTETGYRNHILSFVGETATDYTLYVKAADISGNVTPEATIISFSIDISKAILHWYDPYFELTGWETGLARFGQESDGQTVTAIQDVNVAYFRKEIVIEDPEALTAFGILTKGSDGAVLYLNGGELGRINMDESEEIIYESSATETAVLNQMLVFSDPEALSLVRDSVNVLAVEMHRTAEGSQGIAFDGQMINQSYQIIFGLGSEWSFYDAGIMPPDTIVDVTTEIQLSNAYPTRFVLEQNFPNPFNASTVLRYSLPSQDEVHVVVFNTLGRQVGSFDLGKKQPGYHEFRWTPEFIASGIYFIQLSAGSHTSIQKCIQLK